MFAERKESSETKKKNGWRRQEDTEKPQEESGTHHDLNIQQAHWREGRISVYKCIEWFCSISWSTGARRAKRWWSRTIWRSSPCCWEISVSMEELDECLSSEAQRHGWSDNCQFSWEIRERRDENPFCQEENNFESFRAVWRNEIIPWPIWVGRRHNFRRR